MIKIPDLDLFGWEDTEDPTQDLLIYLALALRALRKIEGRGENIIFRNRFLVLPGLERAYREAVHLRMKTEYIIHTRFVTKMGRRS